MAPARTGIGIAPLQEDAATGWRAPGSQALNDNDIIGRAGEAINRIAITIVGGLVRTMTRNCRVIGVPIEGVKFAVRVRPRSNAGRVCLGVSVITVRAQYAAGGGLQWEEQARCNDEEADAADWRRNCHADFQYTRGCWRGNCTCLSREV